MFCREDVSVQTTYTTKTRALIAHYLERLIIKAGFWKLMGFSLKGVSEVI